MVIALLFGSFIASADIREITQGHLPQVTYSTVVLAVYTGCLAASSSLERLFRLGFAGFALGAAIRAICHYSGLSLAVQREAAISGLALSLLATIAISVAAVQWFWKVVHIQTNDEPR